MKRTANLSLVTRDWHILYLVQTLPVNRPLVQYSALLQQHEFLDGMEVTGLNAVEIHPTGHLTTTRILT